MGNEAIEGWGTGGETANMRWGRAVGMYTRPDIKLHGAACSNVAFASEDRLIVAQKAVEGGLRGTSKHRRRLGGRGNDGLWIAYGSS